MHLCCRRCLSPLHEDIDATYEERRRERKGEFSCWQRFKQKFGFCDCRHGTDAAESGDTDSDGDNEGDGDRDGIVTSPASSKTRKLSMAPTAAAATATADSKQLDDTKKRTGKRRDNGEGLADSQPASRRRAATTTASNGTKRLRRSSSRPRLARAGSSASMRSLGTPRSEKLERQLSGAVGALHEHAAASTELGLTTEEVFLAITILNHVNPELLSSEPPQDSASVYSSIQHRASIVL